MRKAIIEFSKVDKAPATANAGLWLDKFISDFERGENKKNDENSENSRSKLVKQVAGIGLPDDYGKHFKRWQNNLEMIGAQCRKATVKGRMAVGLGDKGVLETSITLHRTYGVPYIPGSALKGLTANFAQLHLKDDKWREGGTYHKVIFGSTTNAGYVTFFDALLVPESGNSLLRDILTVHHQDYYGGMDLPPADWDSPNPVPFLSAKGTYLIALSAPPGCDEWLTVTWNLLESALLHLGIGAKTSSGYGRMTLEKAPMDLDTELADDLIKRIQVISTNLFSGSIAAFIKEMTDKHFNETQTRRVAEVIIAEVIKRNLEKNSKEKTWYKNFLAIVNSTIG